MTGKELIIYILQNNLEDEEMFQDGQFIGLMNEAQTAAKFDVGVATVQAWYISGMIQGVKIGDAIFLYKNVADPRTNIK